MAHFLEKNLWVWCLVRSGEHSGTAVGGFFSNFVVPMRRKRRKESFWSGKTTAIRRKITHTSVKQVSPKGWIIVISYEIQYKFVALLCSVVLRWPQLFSFVAHADPPRFGIPSVPSWPCSEAFWRKEALRRSACDATFWRQPRLGRFQPSWFISCKKYLYCWGHENLQVATKTWMLDNTDIWSYVYNETYGANDALLMCPWYRRELKALCTFAGL